MKWIQGDLHLHTVHSDGVYTLRDIDAIARQLGLGFMALTDHNTVSQNTAYPGESSVTYIPAMEFTTYRGHANLFGVERPCDDFRVKTVDDVQRLLAQARARGARIAVNHPFDDAGPSCQWQWGYEVPFDWLEVWNGPWRESNAKSLALWQSMLCDGKRVIAVGGSDTHREHPYVRHGFPTSYVHSVSTRVTDILDAIAAGRITLTFCPNGPRLELYAPDAVMGGETAETSYTIEVSGVSLGDEVVLHTESGPVVRHVVENDGHVVIRGAHSAKQFLRAELSRHFPQVDAKLVAALSNPIFVS